MKLFTKCIFLTLFFILLSFLYMDFLEEDYFKIKNIEVNGGLVLLDGEIHDTLITLKGKNIWNIDTKKIKAELEQKKQNDKAFAENGAAQLDWVYRQSPYYEKAHLQYPVFRVN